jgi:hypothetical protein
MVDIEDLRDAVPAYSNTVCDVDGQLVSLKGFDGKYLYGVNKDGSCIVDSSSLVCLPKAPQLPRYINTDRGYAICIERLPYRLWKQGVCDDNTKFVKAFDKGIRERAFLSEVLGNLLTQERTYPSVEGSLSLLRARERRSIAIDGQICLVGERGDIFYNNIRIGYFGLEGTKPFVLPKYANIIKVNKCLQ